MYMLYNNNINCFIYSILCYDIQLMSDVYLLGYLFSAFIILYLPQLIRTVLYYFQYMCLSHELLLHFTYPIRMQYTQKKNVVSNSTENLSFCEYSVKKIYRILSKKEGFSTKFDRSFFLHMHICRKNTYSDVRVVRFIYNKLQINYK